MRVRLLVSTAVPVLAFVVTFSVLLWQQHNTDATAARPAIASTAASDAGGASALPASMAPAADLRTSAGSAMTPAASTDVAPDAPAPAPAADNRADSEVPVKLLVRPAQEGTAQVASLVNLSSEPLDLRVTAVNPHTHMRSVIDIALLQHERKNLLTAGLSFSPGDEVTIESQSYRKLVSQVP
jgi:hypothetical protein